MIASQYQTNHASLTPSTVTVVIAGLMASHVMTGYQVPTSDAEHSDALSVAPYRTKSALPSFDQYRSIFGSLYDHVPDQFVESISKFYATLVANQEPLGVEFSRVLHENLWDLYER